MKVSVLTASVPTGNLRFVQKMTSNGNILYEADYIVEIDRPGTDQSSNYFNAQYGPYTLLNPETSGILSETFTPYIDVNGDGQFNAATECLGTPAVLVYFITNTLSTVKNGRWNDPTTWSCGRIPTLGDPVTISHMVTVPSQLTAVAQRVSYTTGGRILFGSNSQLRLGSAPCSIPISADPTTILTQNTWQIEELRAIYNNTLSYYKRGATGNTVNYDNDYPIRFNSDGTGFITANGFSTPLTWNFENPERTKARINWQGLVIYWENLLYSDTIISYTEYYNQPGGNSLGQIKRTVR